MGFQNHKNVVLEEKRRRFYGYKWLKDDNANNDVNSVASTIHMKEIDENYSVNITNNYRLKDYLWKSIFLLFLSKKTQGLFTMNSTL